MKYYIYSKCFENGCFQVSKGSFNEIVDSYSFYFPIWRIETQTKYCKMVIYCALIDSEIPHQIGFTFEEED